jgi:hypothetical protein
LLRDISAHPSPTRLSMVRVALGRSHSNNLMVRVVVRLSQSNNCAIGLTPRCKAMPVWTLK